MAVDDVATVWGFLGSTAAILLGLTFPCLAYVQLRKTPQNRPTTVSQRKAIAWAIIICSVLLIPACLGVATMDVLNTHANSTHT